MELMLETANSSRGGGFVRTFREVVFGLMLLVSEAFASEVVDVSCLGIDFYHGYRSVATDARARKNLALTLDRVSGEVIRHSGLFTSVFYKDWSGDEIILGAFADTRLFDVKVNLTTLSISIFERIGAGTSAYETCVDGVGSGSSRCQLRALPLILDRVCHDQIEKDVTELS